MEPSTTARVNVYIMCRDFFITYGHHPHIIVKKTTIKKKQYTMYNQRCISMKTYDIHVNEKETKLQHFKHKTKKE